MGRTIDPNLFIIGAQKAGTTYLAQALSTHPEVFFSDPKETMFFSRGMTRTNESYRDYLSEYFKGGHEKTWRAEGSTTYLQWPEVLPELRKYVPGHPKFIVCLRQPLAKALSFFVHNWRRDRYAPETTLADTLDFPITLSPYKTSLYASSLERWLEAYPKEDFLFLKFDLLQADPKGFVRAATDFLEIDTVTAVPQTQVNAGLPLVWEEDVLTISPNAARNKVDQRPRFKVKELHDLQNLFLDDLRKTEVLTGLDLSSWMKMPEL